MTLPTDYADAHGRHWGDAELLYERQRLGNADQLYGFSAECGLKALLGVLGMRPDSSGKLPGRYLKHIQDLWPEFKTFAKARSGWRFLSQLPGGSPFADWSHHDRYAHSRYVGSEAVNQHRTAALGVRRMVKRARRDGTL